MGHAVMEALMDRIYRNVPVAQIKLNPKNTRKHSSRQIEQIGQSIKTLGFAAPVLLDENYVLLAGEGRWSAAKLLKLKEIPAVIITGLSEAKKRALLLADNKIAANGGWDRKQLAVEIPELSDLLIAEGVDISLTGFEAPEVDQLAIDFEETSWEPSDQWRSEWAAGPRVSKPGDLWFLGDHRLLCGDARSEVDVARVMGDRRAAASFLDPPYDLKIRNIVGRGRNKHPEFRMASGEMGSVGFISFLRDTLGTAARACRDGAVCYVCIDWRHIAELITAGRSVFGEMLNLVIWVKSNAGLGGIYRSQHELIGVFQVGKTRPLNNVELG